MVLMRLLILASKKKMLHKICNIRKWSKKQMMFKDRNKNYRGVCASAKMQPCFQLCSNSLQQRCGADEQPTIGRWLLHEASGIRRLVISFHCLLKNSKRRNQQIRNHFILKKSEDKNILYMCALRLPENVCDGHTRLALSMPACLLR